MWIIKKHIRSYSLSQIAIFDIQYDNNIKMVSLLTLYTVMSNSYVKDK